MKSLTAAQKRVLKLIGHGWRSKPGVGSSVMVNNKRICNVDTMMALFREGLAQKDEQGCWSATERGKEVTAELKL
jgi:hypothetical protein